MLAGRRRAARRHRAQAGVIARSRSRTQLLGPACDGITRAASCAQGSPRRPIDPRPPLLYLVAPLFHLPRACVRTDLVPPESVIVAGLNSDWRAAALVPPAGGGARRRALTPSPSQEAASESTEGMFCRPLLHLLRRRNADATRARRTVQAAPLRLSARGAAEAGGGGAGRSGRRVPSTGGGECRRAHLGSGRSPILVRPRTVEDT